MEAHQSFCIPLFICKMGARTSESEEDFRQKSSIMVPWKSSQIEVFEVFMDFTIKILFERTIFLQQSKQKILYKPSEIKVYICPI